jgi:hypothetical protein
MSSGYLFAGDIDPYPSKELFKSIKGFQKENSLKVDGIIKPFGETEALLSKSYNIAVERQVSSYAGSSPYNFFINSSDLKVESSLVNSSNSVVRKASINSIIINKVVSFANDVDMSVEDVINDGGKVLNSSGHNLKDSLIKAIKVASYSYGGGSSTAYGSSSSSASSGNLGSKKKPFKSIIFRPRLLSSGAISISSGFSIDNLNTFKNLKLYAYKTKLINGKRKRLLKTKRVISVKEKQNYFNIIKRHKKLLLPANNTEVIEVILT